MATLEIPRSEWVSFFDSFNNRHRGRLITMEIMNPDFGDQVEVRDLPLEGITVELSEENDQFEITVGYERDQHLSKTIPGPRKVWLKQDDEGADEALEIDAKTEKTLLLLRAAVSTGRVTAS